MKKSLFTVCCIALMMTCMVPTYALDETETVTMEMRETDGAVVPVESQYTYSISNEEVTILGLVDPEMSSEIHLILPETIEGYPVVAIGDYAFRGNKNIKSVSFEAAKHLKSIGSLAFSECTNLGGTLTLTASIVEMKGYDTFYNTGITKVVVEDGTEPLKIPSKAFYRCKKLKEVVLSGRVTCIGQLAFSETQALESVEWLLGEYELTIEEMAFEKSNLSSFKAPAQLVSIGQRAFSRCMNLKSVELNDGLAFIGAEAFGNSKNLTGKIVIPASVTEMAGNDSMYGPFCNTAITELVIEDGLEPLTIPKKTFASCKNLHTVVLPSRVTVLEDYAFQNAQSLQNLSWASGEWTQKIGKYAFNGTSLKEFIAPAKLTHIGERAFLAVSSLETLVLNEGLKELGGEAFYNCVNLTGKITVPSTVTGFKFIDYGIFENTAITEVEIKDADTPIKMANRMFANCTQLKKVTLPARVYYIATSAFDGDCALDDFTWEPGPENRSLGAYAFRNTAISEFVCPDNLIKISSDAFEGTLLVEFVCPDSLTEIGSGAFRECVNLKSFQLNDQIKKLNAGLFSNCTSLKGKWVVPETVTDLETGVFRGTSITELYIEDGSEPMAIRPGAFGGCDTLRKVTIPGRVTNMSKRAMDDSQSVKEVHIVNIQKGVTFANLPSGESKGYTFGGWRTDKGVKVTTTSQMLTLDETVIYPRWTGNSYTVSLYVDTYYSTWRTVNVVYGEPYGELPTYTREGYRFKEWNTKADGSGIAITPDMIVTTASNHALYAQLVSNDQILMETPFTDISPNKWYYQSVKWAYENGLITGTSDTEFSPNGPMTRGMLVTVLYRKEGRPKPTIPNTFPDVLSGKYYVNAVRWASSLNIVSGYNNGNFGPEDSITREQLAKILYRYAEYKGYDVTASKELTGFSDASKVASYAEKYMKWAVAEGLIQGSDGKLNPKGNATRAEIAAILKRFVEKYEV